MSFVDYIKIVGDHTKSFDEEGTRRFEWTQTELDSEVVIKAMSGLAHLIAPDFPPPVHRLSKNVWSISRSIVYNDCRVHVLGTSEREMMPQGLTLEATDKSREAIVLCVLPGVGLEFVDLRSQVSVDIRTAVIPLYPNDIDALAANQLSIEQLIEYKLFRRILAERPDVETQYVKRIFGEYGCVTVSHPKLFMDIDQAIEIRGEIESEWLEHPYLKQIDSQILRRRHTLIFGYSSSGKSVLTFQVGRKRESGGWQVGYINLSDDISWPGGLIQSLLFSVLEGPENQLIIVDDLQSRPVLARLFLALGSLLHRVRDRKRSVILGVSWKEFASEAAALCPEVVPFATHAYLVRDRLLDKYSKLIDSETIEAIASESGDDLYLLRLALEVTVRQKAPAGREEVAEDVWLHKVPTGNKPLMSESARRAALLTGAIGQFDIHIPPDFVQRIAQIDARVISQLMETRLLRRIGDKVTLGHRSLCALIAWWLGKSGAWQELKSVGGPHDVTSSVLTYLESSGTGVMIEAIRSLVARAGFKNREALSNRTTVIMDVWRAFDAVIERVERQQAVDPTWGNTPSSSMFVTILLNEIGKGDLAKPSVDFLRKHWQEANGSLEIDTSGFSTVVDFDIIRQRMMDEDDVSPPQLETALEIDVDRFHRTWILGLILGAEAASESPRFPLDHLASLVEKEQIQTTGAFYPHRVPWCTARVLLGLAACGRTLTTSRIVSRAVDWLLKDRAEGGGASDGIWNAGTGTWNSPIEATALVILAVVRSGLDPSDERLIAGRKYLLSERENWEGLEGAAAIEALLASGSRWEDVASDTAQLSQRALDQSLWLKATLPANEILQQTCHVAQATTHLIGIGWTAIQSDLDKLLEALELPTESSPFEEILSNPPQIENEASSKPAKIELQFNIDEMASLVSEISELPLSRFCIIGDYLRFDDRARNDLQNRCNTINKSLDSKSLGRENFLIWAPPGTGKTYFVTEIARIRGEAFENQNFRLLNLSNMSKDTFLAEINRLSADYSDPTLCMIDEIDSRSTEDWPYESFFSCLDWNIKSDRHILFILAGSGQKGLNGMLGAIRDRPRGTDLVDRIPIANQFEIPSPVNEDRLVVFAKQVLIAAESRRQEVTEIERLALYYLLKNVTLTTSRQLTELAKASVTRMDTSENRLLYDHLFRIGDNQRMGFWAKNLEASELLQGTFVWIQN